MANDTNPIWFAIAGVAVGTLMMISRHLKDIYEALTALAAK